MTPFTFSKRVLWSKAAPSVLPWVGENGFSFWYFSVLASALRYQPMEASTKHYLHFSSMPFGTSWLLTSNNCKLMSKILLTTAKFNDSKFFLKQATQAIWIQQNSSTQKLGFISRADIWNVCRVIFENLFGRLWWWVEIKFLPSFVRQFYFNKNRKKLFEYLLDHKIQHILSIIVNSFNDHIRALQNILRSHSLWSKPIKQIKY